MLRMAKQRSFKRQPMEASSLSDNNPYLPLPTSLIGQTPTLPFVLRRTSRSSSSNGGGRASCLFSSPNKTSSPVYGPGVHSSGVQRSSNPIPYLNFCHSDTSSRSVKYKDILRSRSSLCHHITGHRDNYCPRNTPQWHTDCVSRVVPRIRVRPPAYAVKRHLRFAADRSITWDSTVAIPLTNHAGWPSPDCSLGNTHLKPDDLQPLLRLV
ncbi:hypothetical protein B0H67DRAFT_131391 [Lasiosphaeris hirsuta]|uniref:Uncharacterized protein n=1 Tax=Lasiosphaeris hirsuta TaxID=260670 RepID=A0AA40E2D1_9PEZI|nr:hypothetical protein B0H67DRAFT_131391 [Lasiosphaeris hirsuta]